MKKILSSLMLSTFIGLSAIAQISTNGLVAYYPFNGNANDESGNGNNGTVTGATLTTDRFGICNSAYNFNGTSNFITVPDASNLHLNTFTIATWVSMHDTLSTSTQTIINKPRIGGGTGIELSLTKEFSNSPYTYYGAFQITSNQFFTNSKVKPNYNKWDFVVLTYDGTNMKMYINNILKKTTAASAPQSSTLPLAIGYMDPTIKRYMSGNIDDIRIYNRSLNATEINLIYNELKSNCTITVADTLVINANLTGFNPITYQNNIKVYPNPTFDKVTIDCGSNYSTLNGYSIKITNSLSQTVYTSLVNKQTTTIDLNSWTGKGIYFIQLLDGSSNVIENKKIVLQ